MAGDRLLTVENGVPPRSVIKDAQSAHAIKRRLVQADLPRNRQRTTLKAMYDGHPPFDPKDLRDRGQGDRSNVNMKRAKAMTDQMADSYLDQQFETPTFADVSIEFGISGYKGAEWSRIASDEYNRVLTRWNGFYDVMAKSNFNRCFYGVGPLYFENKLNWRPFAAQAGQAFVDKDAPTDISKVDVVLLKRMWPLHEIWRYIEDAAKATSMGWNVKAVKDAMERAQMDSQGGQKSTFDFEWFLQSMKGNDLYWTYVSPQLMTYEMLTVEYDQKVSLRLLTDNDSADILYTDYNCGECMERMIFPFFLSKQEGDWHSVRGLGAQFYNVLRALDLIDNQILDMTIISGTLVIKPQTATAYDKLNMVRLGPITVIPPGVEFVNATWPNLSSGGMVTHNMLMQTLQQTTSQYQPRTDATQTGEAPTATQVSADLGSMARMGASQINQFYNEQDNLQTEMFRRLANPNLPNKNSYLGKQKWCVEAREFQDRCLARGVPLKALQEPYLQQVKATRSIGHGSYAQKAALANELMQMLPLIQNRDARNVVVRDVFAAKFGNRLTNRYFPTETSVALRSDTKTAELENAGMKAGNAFDVLDHEDAVIHLGIHLPLMAQAAQAATQSQGQTQAPSMQVVQQSYALLAIALPHCAQHLQVIGSDPTESQNVKQFGAALQQISKVAQQLALKLRNAASAAQKQAITQANQQNAQSMKNNLEAQKLQLAVRKQASKETLDNAKLQLAMLKVHADTLKGAQDMRLKDLSMAQQLQNSLTGTPDEEDDQAPNLATSANS